MRDPLSRDATSNTPLNEDMDAQRWAKEFIGHWGGHKIGSPDVDEGLMISWFANAIMCGHDVALRRANAFNAAPTPAVTGSLDATSHGASAAAPNVGQLLLAVARCAYYALEDSEETSAGHVVTNEHAVELQAALEALEDLPAEPGYTNCGPNNAAYALRSVACIPSATPITADESGDSEDAIRYRFIRAKLCNRQSLEFDRFPHVLNLAGLASIKPSEIDAAVDAMREEL